MLTHGVSDFTELDLCKCMDKHAYLNWNSKNGATKVQNEGFGISEICNCSQEESVFCKLILKCEQNICSLNLLSKIVVHLTVCKIG